MEHIPGIVFLVIMNPKPTREGTMRFHNALARRIDLHTYFHERLDTTAQRISEVQNAVVFFEISNQQQFVELLQLAGQLIPLLRSGLVRMFGTVDHISPQHVTQLSKFAEVLPAGTPYKVLSNKLTRNAILIDKAWGIKVLETAPNLETPVLSEPETDPVPPQEQGDHENWEGRFAQTSLEMRVWTFDNEKHKPLGEAEPAQFLDLFENEFTLETSKYGLHVGEHLKVSIEVKKAHPPIKFTVVGEIAEIEGGADRKYNVTLLLKNFNEKALERFSKVFSAIQKEISLFMSKAKGDV